MIIYFLHNYSIKMFPILPCDVKLQPVRGHSGNNCIKKYTKIWNELVDKSTNAEIQESLQSKNQEDLLRFLIFMFMTCLHDEELDFSQDRFERFQDVLSFCPRNILTEFLMGIFEDDDVLRLLEGRDDIWIMFFVGLFELGENDTVHYWINHLSEIYQDDEFVLNLFSLLACEIINQELPHDIRQKIYNFVAQTQNIHDESLQVPELQPHRTVDADAFVCRTFPSQHPLALDGQYICGMCRCGPDETSEDGSIPVFRSMSCCHHKQMACHDCLVNCATLCNTPDPHNEFKNTRVFGCPYCRTETEFFPNENWFNFHE